MYQLLGARHLDFETYGFLQPIFIAVGTQSYFYQVVTDGYIEEFEQCKPDFEIKNESFFYCEEELLFTVNDKAAYFFLSREKKYFAGNLNNISPKISGFLYDPAYTFLEKLEIATELSCWGFINNHYRTIDEDFINDFEEYDVDVPLAAELKIYVEQDIFQHIASEDEYIAQLNSLAKNYGLEVRDLLIYNDRYAIAGNTYCHLSNTLINKIKEDKIFIDNVKYIEEELAGELLKKDSALFKTLEDRIDQEENGVEILESLQPLVLSLINMWRPAEKQMIELLVSESSKSPRQTSLLPDRVNEVSQMADIVIKNRKKPALA